MGKVFRHKRNCDRFNSGDSDKDFMDAICKYTDETGLTVWNCCPGYTTSGDFVKWLLTKVKGNKVKGNGK